MPQYPVIDKVKTGKQLKQLIKNKGYTIKDIQQYLSLSCIQTIYRWFEMCIRDRYNSATYSTADIFSTYVYRKGLLNAQYSFASAVGLANSMINVVILLGANFLAKKTTETSIF